MPIPDVTTVEVPITVPDTGSVADVNVRVRINHTFDSDLDISLVHPDGTVIDLPLTMEASVTTMAQERTIVREC